MNQPFFLSNGNLLGPSGSGRIDPSCLSSLVYISRGAFALVYRAVLTNPVDGSVTPVAVKVLKPGSHPQYCQRFLQEVAVHSELQHG